MDADTTLRRLGLADPHAVALAADRRSGSGQTLAVRGCIDGATLAAFPQAVAADVDEAVRVAQEAFETLRCVPAPRRGELVRRLGNKLRERKSDLGAVVTLEAGKSVQEAEGEVQEMIDVCDFAVGLSRQLYGLTIATERPHHRMMEQWHPLGPVAVITAFNFPVAVWAWNAALALVCGDPVVWKPSEKTPLTALACHGILQEVIGESGDLGVPAGVSGVLVGGREVGEAMADHHGFPLVSATGSVRMGRAVGAAVGARLGRSLLELGGNNAMIVAPSADPDLALRAITFSAFGTAGQRCTTMRRLIVHEEAADGLLPRLKKVASTLQIGDPRDAGVLLGPLIDEAAHQAMQRALECARDAGATVTGGERVTEGVPGGVYVRPAIVEGLEAGSPLIAEETFAPILYVLPYRELDEAIRIHNDVPQGLASAIFTADVREAERFLSASGSDCGIANVNIGTSGAEIGGAFGGEKDTGGGRESGSDAWKNYMRRATNTINFGHDLPLAQGVNFEAAL
ncbi:L-piperidine-6-carboxylate dehydrogenase [Phycisphaera mikurensis]|uniref:aldehyde dehydrogenase (NAD(+)) n=1 Tax=Phycisphaera mikurensis (strain NBRC 102666 / KCTC 22515 / FYK2301M01) TaxID=1142394 RepID=I0ICS3_PHYMF|nr:aldehyde dehydrogenase family protein [Phycisphaera mikurensis]MBB6443318.1 aldehyde dehydrogenase (NAD+) [Phycisphaera mikurensis]BAM03061.1 putative piperideine-6-carboxylate dehydrogenase [Phycisphaera mikurensis NBRC 102666]